MNGDHTDRLSQEGECREESEGGILESASTFAQRVLEEIEALAGTTACKSVQLVKLKKWAQEQGCWFDSPTQFGDCILSIPLSSSLILVASTHTIAYRREQVNQSDKK